MVGFLLVAAFAESAAVDAAVDEVIQLVSDGGNDFPRKMMNGAQGCPRILMPCKVDSDCFPTCKCRSNGYERVKGIMGNKREKMEWKRGALIAMVGLLLMAAFAESAAVHGGEVIQLVSDGVNDFPRKMMNGALGCPRILMECEVDSDCLPGCICRPNGFCG
ncbi:hypothetical protein SDJN02_22573, partial [Cucurbita argyrosperma subsp. argyrosperma]